MHNHPPALIIIGGFAGTGKSTVARRLSTDFCVPRLGSDQIGRAVKMSAGCKQADIDGQRIAYDVLFRLCEEFIGSGVSVILDMTMGWAFQWRQTDATLSRHPDTLCLPLILRCSSERYMARIQQRHAAHPAYYDAPDVYTSDQRILDIRQFLKALDRPEVHFIDAEPEADQVYETVRSCLTEMMK